MKRRLARFLAALGLAGLTAALARRGKLAAVPRMLGKARGRLAGENTGMTTAERRSGTDRRSGQERRVDHGAPPDEERRLGAERRSGLERRGT